MMNLHLAAISADLVPGRHALLLADQTGWPPLPQVRGAPQHHHCPAAPQCPELNPQENIWQIIRDNWLSNRVLDDIHALSDHCCEAWNKLEAQPWTIMSIGMRDWAYRF